MLKNNRKSLIAAALITTGAVCTFTIGSYTLARADDMGTKMTEMPAASPELEQAAMKCMNMAKQDAADSTKMDEMKTMLAKMMVMDKMSMMLAKDTAFTDQVKADKDDSQQKMVHDQAKQMSEDQSQMMAIAQKIESDPKEMAMVTHHAAMLSMMHEGMADKMGDKMNSMGSEMDKSK